MELSESQQLAFIIEKLTTTGSTTLDKADLKKLKLLCKKSSDHVQHAFHLLFTQLEKDHSEIRLAALFVVDELFQRSHIFRELLLENFHEFLELAAETNFDMPLPEPRSAAKEVVKKAVKCIHSWHEKYGPAYKKLILGYNYLRGTKKMQLVNADEVQTRIQRNAMEERQRKKDESRTKRLGKVTKDIEADLPEIEACIAEIEACFSLLVPNFGAEVPASKTSPLAETYQEKLRQSGLISHDYNLNLDLSKDILSSVKVKENKDNESVLENLKDRERVLQKVHFPKVKKWLTILGLCGAPSELLKTIIDLKLAITKSIEKSTDLIVVDFAKGDNEPMTSGLGLHSGDLSRFHKDCTDSSSEDDDFIEVEEKPKFLLRTRTEPDKQGVSSNTGETKSENVNVWKPIRPDDDVSDPASYSRALAVQKEKIKESEGKDSRSVNSKLVKIHPKSKKTFQKIESGQVSSANSKDDIHTSAPIVSFGPDLLEWDEQKKQELKESISMGSAKEYDIGHRFYGSDTSSKAEGGVSEAALAALTTRSIAFTGEFEPVKWSCRAPLPSGRLCPRKDRVKCPLHGPIIARDANGLPVDPKHRQKHIDNADDWQDPALLRELKAVTGIDLKMPEKRKQKKRKKATYDNLTDVKILKDTSRYRLEKKVLDPRSLKRVSETMDAIEAKRNFQKFGNNFNYALN